MVGHESLSEGEGEGEEVLLLVLEEMKEDQHVNVDYLL